VGYHISAKPGVSRRTWIVLICLGVLVMVIMIACAIGFAPAAIAYLDSYGIDVPTSPPVRQIIVPAYVGKWTYHAGWTDIILVINRDGTGDFGGTAFTWQDENGQMQAKTLDKNTGKTLYFSVEAGGSQQVIVHGWDSFGLHQGATSVFNRLQ